ncbi:uncharacterized protein LTR77_001745 [Saxophila tyrrhenica]|uniref:Glycosyltransferase family 69 protein n=1 Tax=Saxophila tyrrhenica TaxID=1690608 RepID=A0AAV9PKZ7_9PEZI|nr:hypothetical protein LTR77_001745 [Saxophila tyrrhenica]
MSDTPVWDILSVLHESSATEKIFIAASLYDKEGALLSGHWGQSVHRLINILGHENVFLSIYEDNPDQESRRALYDFEASLPCDSSIKHEDYDGSDLQHIILPDGTRRLRRIAFLAEVRNRALRPLEDAQSKAFNTTWDKLLYLNDVAFDPIDAANLLFSTNVDESTGKTNYRAACAMDFINPFKFYDTLAARDIEGYSMGVPFYPWFSNAGKAASRHDVLDQKDAVQVKSCWGGMVAFEGKWFQPWVHQPASSAEDPSQPPADVEYEPHRGDLLKSRSTEGHEEQGIDALARNVQLMTTTNTTPASPLRFRSETDSYWDASECCLIHADLASLVSAGSSSSSVSDQEPAIFMNPYIRVAYSPSVLRWLPFTSRFERLYTWPHRLINIIARRPSYNPRQFQKEGDEVVDRVWRWDEDSMEAVRNGTIADVEGGMQGRYVSVRRKATAGMFCGGRRARYALDAKKGDREGHWGAFDAPVDVG